MYASMADTITSVMRSAHRDVSLTRKLIIPGKISIIPLQVPPTGRGKTPQAPPLLGDPEGDLEKYKIQK
ncbi:hypothetical protein E2C01_059704 [Portunus trituberculatus]|uniref:Uncharacterized protein n=1 Tax=Portunus trituberculatus TaxID=210409 RepID=A0A5B7H6K5_PORTR|nr:hypothetical protein [Portunus trituberculatus]